MVTITYRNLDANNDPIRGQGQANYLSDIDAVAQAIRTRLLLFEGEWWADVTDGTPYWQSILGKAAKSNLAAINLILTQRILRTPGVVGVSQINSDFNVNTQQFSFNITVQTQFGVVAVSNQPLQPSQVLP